MTPELIMFLSHLTATVAGVAIGMVAMLVFAVHPIHRAFTEYKESSETYTDMLINYNRELKKLADAQGAAIRASDL